MACCLLLLRLLAPISSRIGIGDPTRAPRVPVVPIVALGLVEAAVAWAVVRRADSVTAAPMVHAHHVPGGSSGITLGTACALFFTVAVAINGLRWAGRAQHPWGLAGVAAAVVAGVVAISDAAAASHAVMMLVIELSLVIAPVAIVGSTVNTAAADDVWAVARGALALVAAIGVVFLLITLHLPSTHHWYLMSNGLAWWLTPLLLASGLAFWSSVMRFRLPSGWRTLLLVGVLETGAVIGLVLLLAGDQLVPMVAGSDLGVLVDQRMAGAIMMLVDLVLLARTVDPVLRPGVRDVVAVR